MPGAGSALLRAAQQRAALAGLVPVLQVHPDSPARAFYGRRGWVEVGVARQRWGGQTVDAVLMIGTSDDHLE